MSRSRKRSQGKTRPGRNERVSASSDDFVANVVDEDFMKLYIGDKNLSSWSLRPWLVLKQFDLPFEECMIRLDQSESKSNIRAVSPAGRVPFLQDGALGIGESLAICEYLADKFPARGLWPWRLEERARARAISHEMHAGFARLRQECPMMAAQTFSDFRPSEAVRRDVRRIDQIWREALERSGGPFLFGQFSIADAMYAPVVSRIRTYRLPVSSAARAFGETIAALPAMRQWVADAEREIARES